MAAHVSTADCVQTSTGPVLYSEAPQDYWPIASQYILLFSHIHPLYY